MLPVKRLVARLCMCLALVSLDRESITSPRGFFSKTGSGMAAICWKPTRLDIGDTQLREFWRRRGLPIRVIASSLRVTTVLLCHSGQDFANAPLEPTHFPLGPRMAQNFMRLSANTKHVSHLPTEMPIMRHTRRLMGVWVPHAPSRDAGAISYR
jgi:hypothetical protein